MFNFINILSQIYLFHLLGVMITRHSASSEQTNSALSLSLCQGSVDISLKEQGINIFRFLPALSLQNRNIHRQRISDLTQLDFHKISFSQTSSRPAHGLYFLTCSPSEHFIHSSFVERWCYSPSGSFLFLLTKHPSHS